MRFTSTSLSRQYVLNDSNYGEGLVTAPVAIITGATLFRLEAKLSLPRSTLPIVLTVRPLEIVPAYKTTLEDPMSETLVARSDAVTGV